MSADWQNKRAERSENETQSELGMSPTKKTQLCSQWHIGCPVPISPTNLFTIALPCFHTSFRFILFIVFAHFVVTWQSGQLGFVHTPFFCAGVFNFALSHSRTCICLRKQLGNTFDISPEESTWKHRSALRKQLTTLSSPGRKCRGRVARSPLLGHTGVLYKSLAVGVFYRWFICKV